MRCLIASLAVLTLLGVDTPPEAHASQLAALGGIVQDQSGLPVPGAAVEVLAEAGELLGSTTTDRNGTWSVTGVPLGEVRVTVSLAGFRTETATVDVGSATARVATILRVGGYSSAIAVTASRGERTLAAVPAAVSVVDGATVAATAGVNLADTLRLVPGVSAGNVSGVDDLRISIRGAGVRASFGSRGVLLLADGFPVTEPDGQTPHFDGQIDLSNAERIEVVKGPSSAVYGGAALGGVVNVITRPPSRQPGLLTRAEAGTYAFGKTHTTASTGLGPVVVGGSIGFTHLDGFRAHNSLSNWAGTARADWTHGASRMTTSFLATDASLNLPGTIDRAQFNRDPKAVRSIYVDNDWGRENRLFRVGGRYERLLNGGQSLEFAVYGQTRDLFHPIFVVIDQDARRFVSHGRYQLTRGRHAFSAGVDLDRQAVEDRWFVNAGGAPTFPIRNDENLITNAGVYVQEELTTSAGATLVAGVRADTITYDLVDLRVSDGDASDRRTFTRVSPKLGVTSRVGDRLVAYGNVASGFEAPTLGEVRLPAGFNTEVRPQTAVSIEGGLRGQIGRASFDVSVYHMRVTDEILPETIDDVTVYRNVAKANHTGLEVSTRIRPGGPITMDATYAYSRFVLVEFGEFSKNRLPGIPAHAGTASLSYAHRAGWDATARLVWAGENFVSDVNAETAPAYGIISAQAGYQLGRVRLFLRADNLGDVNYTNRVQVNDSGGFYYAPAPGRNAQLGAEVKW